MSKTIVDNIGGTEFGPAAAFRDIIRAIVLNTNEFFPFAAPMSFDELSEPVFVSVPRCLGDSIGKSIYDKLSAHEKNQLTVAAKKIFETYELTIKELN